MSKKGKNSKSNKMGLKVFLLVVLLALLAGAGMYLLTKQESEAPEQPQLPEVVETEDVGAPETEAVQIEQVETVSMELGYDLTITDIGRYAGVYMEDGSDEIVSNVLMIVVTNNGDAAVQYAEVSVAAGEETASFTLSTLPAGKSVVLLEQNRMEFSADAEYTDGAAQNVALFAEPLSLCEDQFSIQILDGGFNIINISGEDITQPITVYYKNCSSDMYYGGITYRVRLEEGMKNEEIKQIMSDHFSAKGSKIMFVTCG